MFIEHKLGNGTYLRGNFTTGLIEHSLEGQIVMLNDHLLRKQDVSPDSFEKLMLLHYERHKVFAEMRQLDPSDGHQRAELRVLAEVIQDLEFVMQEAWGFNEDYDYHTWWFQVPHCICCKTSNWLLMGQPARAEFTNCPVHGTDDDLYNEEKKITVFKGCGCD